MLLIGLGTSFKASAQAPSDIEWINSTSCTLVLGYREVDVPGSCFNASGSFTVPANSFTPTTTPCVLRASNGYPQAMIFEVYTSPASGSCYSFGFVLYEPISCSGSTVILTSVVPPTTCCPSGYTLQLMIPTVSPPAPSTTNAKIFIY